MRAARIVAHRPCRAQRVTCRAPRSLLRTSERAKGLLGSTGVGWDRARVLGAVVRRWSRPPWSADGPGSHASRRCPTELPKRIRAGSGRGVGAVERRRDAGGEVRGRPCRGGPRSSRFGWDAACRASHQRCRPRWSRAPAPSRLLPRLRAYSEPPTWLHGGRAAGDRRAEAAYPSFRETGEVDPGDLTALPERARRWRSRASFRGARRARPRCWLEVFRRLGAPESTEATREGVARGVQLLAIDLAAAQATVLAQHGRRGQACSKGHRRAAQLGH